MVYLPPVSTIYDSEGKEIPDVRYAQNSVNSMEMETKPVNFQLLNIIDLPFVIILKNMANTVILIILDLFDLRSYKNINTFMAIFTKDNRLLYVGIILILSSMFISFFFN